MTPVVRPARPEDAALILALIRELAAYERLLHECEVTETDIASALFGPEPRVFAEIAEWTANRRESLSGSTIFPTFRGRHGIYLEDLFVRPALRSHGIGQSLLRHLAQRCVREGLPRLEWWVLDWNEPALRFYRRIGARAMDEWTVQRVTGEALEALAR